jgi:hypothetical protein
MALRRIATRRCSVDFDTARPMSVNLAQAAASSTRKEIVISG